MQWFCGCGLVLLLSLNAGCATTTHGNLVAFLNAHRETVGSGEYTVMPPDALRIHAPVAAEIDGAIERVRPDGKIALRLVGEVQVAGMNTEQISAKLRNLLAQYYVDPEVVVNIAQYASQHYYVFGEVTKPGPRLYTGRDTLLRALAESRPTFLAWRSQIRVVRPSEVEEGEPKVITVDLDDMVRSGDLAKNILLQPGDIVEVPPSPLAWVGLRVRELLYPITPALDLYNTPADAIQSTRIYEDEFGSSESDSERRTLIVR